MKEAGADSRKLCRAAKGSRSEESCGPAGDGGAAWVEGHNGTAGLMEAEVPALWMPRDGALVDSLVG